MTAVAESPRYEVRGRVVVVLRRAVMDNRDAAICRAVWRGARTLRTIMAATGIPSTSSVIGRLTANHHYGDRWQGRPALCESGWLCGLEASGTIRPGPRLAGLDSDQWPLEAVNLKED